jgi:hypothetical protein
MLWPRATALVQLNEVSMFSRYTGVVFFKQSELVIIVVILASTNPKVESILFVTSPDVWKPK